MPNEADSISYEFDDFRVDAGKRLLSSGSDGLMPLTPKVFDTLLYLVSHRGAIIGKDELMSAIWSDTIVEENNLNKNISALRRVLGENPTEHRFIVTVPGKGYKFVADVRELPTETAVDPLEEIHKRTDPETLASGPGINNDRPANDITERATKKTSRFWLLTIAAAVIAGLSFLGFYSSNERSIDTPITSVAVLPFVNAGAEGEFEYFSDGLSETLIDRLSELPKLKVIARGSSFKYRDENLDARTVAQKLGVQAIVTGRITRRGDDLIIRVELIDARDNKQIWGEHFNRKASEMLAVQGEIARMLSGKLRLKFLGEQEQQLAKRGTDNPQAYDLLLRGDYLFRTGQAEKLTGAIEYYQQAIALDANYALAYARIARTYGLFANNSILDPKDVVPKAKAAAQKAVELDENLADGHLQLAMLAVDEWDWATAERGFVRAVELNPSHSEAHHRYSSFLSEMGRHEEAIAEAKRGNELDPERLTARMHLLTALLKARRFDDLIAESRKILEIEPEHRGAIGALGSAYSHKGMYAEALKYFESGRADDAPLGSQIWLGAAYARAGEREKARAILRRLETTKEYVSPSELPVLYAALGERDKAFASLEKAYAAHDLQLKYLNSDPNFDPLRDDPRFQDLVRRVGLPL